MLFLERIRHLFFVLSLTSGIFSALILGLLLFLFFQYHGSSEECLDRFKKGPKQWPIGSVALITVVCWISAYILH